MNKILSDIRLSFGSATALYRIMIINIAVFLVIMLVRTIFFLFQLPTDFISLVVLKLSLPAEFGSIILQPWSFVTYMFLHQDFFHILFNMLVLYWMGKLFTEYLGNDKLWATYILGGLAGAALYIIAYSLFPVFDSSSGTHLMGASAGVIAVLIAMATLLPDYAVLLLFFGPVRLKYIAIFSILLYAISIPQGNAGGNIAHLGGALFGFLMVKQMQQGNDITAWLVKLFKRTSKPKMKVVVNKRKTSNDDQYHNESKNRQEIIDRILDKISQSGYSSLSKEEKEILFQASKNIREE